MTILLPKEPMAPIAVDTLPVGEEWGYQIKWDGVRLLARMEEGRTELFSRQMLNKSLLYPEAMELLEPIQQKHTCLIDGEAVIFDQSKQRPNFQLILKRERSRSFKAGVHDGNHFIFVLFDLLYWNGEDLRSLPYVERHRRLLQLVPDKQPQLFVTDLFSDLSALWSWVEQGGWEGVVAKRLASPYREGKRHKDWYKKKTSLLFEVAIPGLIIRGGHVASLIMAKDGVLFGRVSSGLDEKRKAQLLQEGSKRKLDTPQLGTLPAELKKEQILWLRSPFLCTVTGLEVTSDGQLRHPKIVKFHDIK
ncbi:DNA ligase [Paenibacillus radicis (ex Xue et al. 2023)]|uniref:DNA ligase (ATP) n=1 Tax=Paenibacillus radicis (ex Xue et al. 2023) TaxID=2972489 RepID=A0ABT1YU24_9BACL|nr:DNA ligase [Paenibacillus radicis (ex Xue et al. 2023)]MCR8636691.1 DNA ligase [Paenibacillus radicis (ex Xue et al. 2023)]